MGNGGEFKKSLESAAKDASQLPAWKAAYLEQVEQQAHFSSAPTHQSNGKSQAQQKPDSSKSK